MLLFGSNTGNLPSSYNKINDRHMYVPLQQITDHAPQGVAIVDPVSEKIIYANHFFSEMLGYCSGELMGQHISVVNAPTNISAKDTADIINSALQIDGKWYGEILNRRKDGSTFWSSARIFRFEDRDSGPLWVSYQSVITERELAEKAMMQAFTSLEHLSFGVIFLNDAMKAIYLNREAEKLVGLGLIDLESNEPKLSDSLNTTRLRQLISSAIQSSLEGCLQGGGNLQTNEESGKPMLEFRVMPLSPQSSSLISTRMASAAIFISRPRELQIPWKKLVTQYKLTPAEVKLASILTEGKSLDAAAKQLSVSINTAKTHLRSIFSKTGTNRQAELVSLLLSSTIPLNHMAI